MEDKENVSQETQEAQAKPKAEETPKPEEKAEASTPVIDAARQAAKELKEATELLKKENDRKEEMMSRDMLGGGDDEAIDNKKTKELDPVEYAKKVATGEVNPLKEYEAK